MKKIKTYLKLIFLSLVSLAIVIGFSKTNVFESIDNWTFDIRQIAFAPDTIASSDIVMVWLDEGTMKNLPYRSPVPRDFLATLNNALVKTEPKIIAYDIFFKDPSFSNEDIVFARSLSLGPCYAVMPMRIGGCEEKNGETNSTGKGSLKDCVDLPLPLFKNSLKGLGLADLPFNAFDSIVRFSKFEFSTDLGITPSIAAIIFENIQEEKAIDVISNQKPWPSFGPFKLTPFVGNNQKTFIRFAGQPGEIGSKTNTFSTYPASLVAKGVLPQTWFKDKIVLVGAAYQDLEDAFLTPYYARSTNFTRMNGVEIHANILSNLLTKQFYYTLQNWQTILLSLLFILIIISATSNLSLIKSTLILILASGAYIFLTILGFKRSGIILPFVFPLSSGLVSFGVGISFRSLTEGRQKRWLKGVFSQYVPPAVVNQMTEHPELVRLGGENRYVTSLFSDIASFTSISEKLSPTALVKFLNDYLSKMNEILFRYGGTIDKYEGDAIIAFFNAPVDLLQHELAATKSAIEMQQASLEMTNKWQDTLGYPIVTRIGLNTGPAVVGNMGSSDRFDYTAIGDTINLASRLEGTNKFYDTRVMASEITVKGIDDSIIVRPIDRVRVKGKKEAILLYEIMGQKSESIDSSQLIDLAKLFTQAYELFEKRNFDQAKTILEQINVKYKQGGPTKIIFEKLARAKQDSNWDLVTEMISK